MQIFSEEKKIIELKSVHLWTLNFCTDKKTMHIQ